MTKYTTNKNSRLDASALISKVKRLSRAIKDAGVFSASVRGCVFGSLIAGQIVLPVVAVAGPAGFNAPNGGATVSGEGTATTTISQSEARVAIGWDSFNLTSTESVTFIQPDTSSVAINNILSNSGSNIAGMINANGHIVLVNPNGIVFTSTAQIDVGGIIASGLAVSNLGDFITNAGGSVNDLEFASATGAGTVTNNGLIAASSIALIGKQVTNSGTLAGDIDFTDGSINLPAEVTYLGSGDSGFVTFGGSEFVGFEMTAGITEALSGDAVLNPGTINSNIVEIEASMANSLITAAVNNSGAITADSLIVTGDTITLASGTDLTSDTVSTTSASLTLESGITIDASSGFIASANTLELETADSNYNTLALTGAAKEIVVGDAGDTNSQLMVTDLSIVNGSNASLKGTTSDEAFSISTTANAVSVNSIDFTSVAAINAGTSTGDGVITTELVDADLTANGNELAASEISFSNINDADLNGGALSGTNDNNETFSISTAARAVNVNDIDFTSVASIDAGTSTGDAITTTEAVDATLTGTDNAVDVSGINFTNVNTAGLTGGSLSGSDNADTFVLDAAGLKANEILFTAINSLVNAEGGLDDVTGMVGIDWTLTANAGELSSTPYQFTGIETADLVSQTLNGTDANNETFEISTVENVVNVKVNDINFTSVASIDAGTSTGDAVTTTETVDAALTANGNELVASTINFSNINDADLSGGALTGTNDNDETFSISTAANTVNVNDIDFTSVTAINAGTSTGDAVTTTELVNADLTANGNELVASTINFSNINDADLSGGALTGTNDNDETFEIDTTNNTVNVNDINFTSVASINAGTSTGDAITTTETVDADLTANGNELVASTINFSNINDADLSGGALTGTNDNDETFSISTTANAVNVNDIDFTSVASINAGTSNGDAITTTETVDADLTANGNELVASTINFSNINDADLSGGALTGTNDSDETFSISTTANAVNVNAIDFTSVAAINAGTSTGDAVTTTEAVDATLTGANNAVDASGINFTNVNSADLTGGALSGSDNADTFV
ncbi:MAG: filamentous hemagglutinin family protein, partial [Thalassolituus sp.]